MEQVIKTLSEIEERAVRMMEHAASTKKELAAISEAKIKAYDEKNEALTQAAIQEQKAQLDRQLQDELASRQAEADKLTARMQADYDDNHTAIAKEIFSRLIKS